MSAVAPSEVGSGSPSRYTGEYPSGPSAPGFSQRVVSRWSLLRYVRELLPGDAVSMCSRAISEYAGGQVEVCRRAGSDGAPYAFYRGLHMCKSVWTCPLCSPRISETRARELNEAVKAAEAQGVQVALISLTFSHHDGVPLRDLLSAFTKALTRSRSGRDWHAIRSEFQPLGYVRALEVTHGSNGWHPHAHELWFLPAGADVEAFAAAYRQQWMRSLDHAGLSGLADRAFDLQIARGSVAQYVAKYGHEPRWGPGRELAKGARKAGRSEHRTAWQILADAAAGDDRSRSLFLSYVDAFKGRRQLQWSPGLRAAFALAEPVSDAEAVEVADSAPCEVVVVLDRLSWYRVYYNDAEASVLVLAARGTAEDVLSYVASLWVPGQPRSG